MHHGLKKLHQVRPILPALVLLLALILTAVGLVQAGQGDPFKEGYIIAGQLVDSQGQPIAEARVTAEMPDVEEPLAETESQEDGNWGLVLTGEPEVGLAVVIERPHFETESILLDANHLADFIVTGTFSLGEIPMQR
jgi:hypothetical protein